MGGMRRPGTFAMTACVLALVLVAQVSPFASPAFGGKSGPAPATAHAGPSSSPDDGLSWRSGAVPTAANAASAWRVNQLHAHLAASPVFAVFDRALPVATSIVDTSRPHAPPHTLRTVLLI